MRKYFLVAAAALMLVGCSKEQSEFKSSDLKNDALPQGTVVGTVKYDAGAYKDASGVIFNEHFVPAAGQQIKIEVGNAAYVAGSAGNQTYMTEVGQDGKFSYTLPLGLAATNVTVSVIPFYAEKKVVVAGQFVSIPDALYNQGVNQAPQAMTNKDIKTFDFLNVTSNAAVEEKMSQKVTVSGKVLLQQWTKDPDDASNFIIDYKASEKKWNLVCEVTTYKSDGITVDQTYTKTGIQTNAEGEYSFTVNLPDNWLDMTKQPTLEVYNKPELDNNFTGKYKEGTDWKSQTCEVLYPSVSQPYNLSADNEIIPAKIDDINIEPELQEKEGIKGIGNAALDIPKGYSSGILNATWIY